MYYLFDEYPLAGVIPICYCRDLVEVRETLLAFEWIVYVMTPECMVYSREKYLQ